MFSCNAWPSKKYFSTNFRQKIIPQKLVRQNAFPTLWNAILCEKLCNYHRPIFHVFEASDRILKVFGPSKCKNLVILDFKGLTIVHYLRYFIKECWNRDLTLNYFCPSEHIHIFHCDLGEPSSSPRVGKAHPVVGKHSTEGPIGLEVQVHDQFMFIKKENKSRSPSLLILSNIVGFYDVEYVLTHSSVTWLPCTG